MNAFYEHHKDSIRFGYRCFDRILLNGLIPYPKCRTMAKAAQSSELSRNATFQLIDAVRFYPGES